MLRVKIHLRNTEVQAISRNVTAQSFMQKDLARMGIWAQPACHQKEKQPEKFSTLSCQAGATRRLQEMAALPSRPFSIKRGEVICLTPAFKLTRRPATKTQGHCPLEPLDQLVNGLISCASDSESMPLDDSFVSYAAVLQCSFCKLLSFSFEPISSTPCIPHCQKSAKI